MPAQLFVEELKSALSVDFVGPVEELDGSAFR